MEEHQYEQRNINTGRRNINTGRRDINTGRRDTNTGRRVIYFLLARYPVFKDRGLRDHMTYSKTLPIQKNICFIVKRTYLEWVMLALKPWFFKAGLRPGRNDIQNAYSWN